MRTPIETTAVIDLTPRDLDNLVEELRAYHAIYSPLFQRREQREWAEKYLHGLLLDLPRKSIEPLVLAMEGVQPRAVRAMQQFLSTARHN
jgi:SRSO17 transposase